MCISVPSVIDVHITFSTCKPLNALPLCCDFLTCKLGTVPVTDKSIMPYLYSITYFYIFHMYVVFNVLSNLKNNINVKCVTLIFF
jgi:hypothetical protein